MYIRMELLDHMVIVYLIFWGPAKLFSTVLTRYFLEKKGSMVNRLHPLTLSWRVTMHFGIVKSLRGPAEKKNNPPPREKEPQLWPTIPQTNLKVEPFFCRVTSNIPAPAGLGNSTLSSVGLTQEGLGLRAREEKSLTAQRRDNPQLSN